MAPGANPVRPTGEDMNHGRAGQIKAGMMTLLMMFGIGVPFGIILSRDGAPAAEASGRLSALPAEEMIPGITLTDFRTEISIRGRTVCLIRADHGRLKTQSASIDLDETEVIFYERGNQAGQVTSPHGRVWLQADPSRAIGRNDMVLWEVAGGDRPVQYRDASGRLISPRMRLFYERGVLRSDDFERIFKMGDTYYHGTGERMEISVDLSGSSLRDGGARPRDMSTTGYTSLVKIDKPDDMP